MKKVFAFVGVLAYVLILSAVNSSPPYKEKTEKGSKEVFKAPAPVLEIDYILLAAAPEMRQTKVKRVVFAKAILVKREFGRYYIIPVRHNYKFQNYLLKWLHDPGIKA